MGFIIPAGTPFALDGSITDNHLLHVALGENIDGKSPPVLLGSDTSGNTGALADATGLSVPVDASGRYWIYAHVLYTITAATGINIAVNGPATPDAMAFLIDVERSNSAVDSGSVNAYDTAITNTTTPANLISTAVIEGIWCGGGNAGNLIVRFGPVDTGGTVTAVIKAGSYIWWQELVGGSGSPIAGGD